MSFQIYSEDRKGNAVDELGNDAVDMDADEEQVPLVNITNFDEYLGLKALVFEQRKNTEGRADSLISDKNVQKGTYKMYSNDVKKHFFLMYEKALTSGQARKELNIARRIVYNRFKKDQKRN